MRPAPTAQAAHLVSVFQTSGRCRKLSTSHDASMEVLRIPWKIQRGRRTARRQCFFCCVFHGKVPKLSIDAIPNAAAATVARRPPARVICMSIGKGFHGPIRRTRNSIPYIKVARKREVALDYAPSSKTAGETTPRRAVAQAPVPAGVEDVRHNDDNLPLLAAKRDIHFASKGISTFGQGGYPLSDKGDIPSHGKGISPFRQGGYPVPDKGDIHFSGLEGALARLKEPLGTGPNEVYHCFRYGEFRSQGEY